jgi:uncharacterized protein (TIGR03790 family)
MALRCLARGLALVLLLGLCGRAGAAEELLATRVLVLANSDDPDSLRIARHYAEARAVPAANVISLPLPLGETITWREFIVALWEPLIERLVREKWLDAIAMDAIDSVGRRKFAPYGHRIASLVVCRGVPLKIAHDSELAGESLPFTRRGEFRTNAGCVDAELSLLPAPNYNINAFVPNPLFQNDRPEDVARHIVKVSRLDGPTAADAMALVDAAKAAERDGLLGRAYVDIGGSYESGNEWLESVARQLADLEFDVAVDRAPTTLPASARFDAPVLYFGWYAGDVNGPFTLPGFRFPPGAIALHIHSYSAASLRGLHAGWTAPFVGRGVTATVGNVNEPYLEFTHRPHLFVRALARGWTLAEAAYYAVNALSWQAVLIGDPLYRPFPKSRWAVGELATLPPHLAGYAAEREMRALARSGRKDEARGAAIRAQRERPSIALGWAIAQSFKEAGELENAANAVSFVGRLERFPADQWALVAEIAGFLWECGRPQRAVEVWATLLKMNELPRDLRVNWLPRAEAAAEAAGEKALAAKWGAEWAELTRPAAASK